MAPDGYIHNRKRAVWGAFFVALGVLLLLERLGVAGFTHVASWWPMLLVVVGFTSLVEGRVGSALSMMLLGGWFFAVTSRWHGLTYGNSWPLVLVIVGVGVVVKALTGEDRWHRRRILRGLADEDLRHRPEEGGRP